LFEHGLSGEVWPIHCKPYGNEVLSSWLVRLSRAYGADPIRFWPQAWPHRVVWAHDMDKGIDDDFLWMLATKTATSRARVLATTMRSYKGYLAEDLMVMQRTPWLLTLAVHTLTRCQPWLQYCPHCLRTDIDPYFRRWWRLAFITACPKHRRCLLDRCENCGAVINFHRLPGDAEVITLCHSCRYDMRLAHAPAIGRGTAYQRLVQFQTFLLDTMKSGSCRLGNFTSVPGARFFAALRKRMQFFLTTMHTPGFKEAFGASLPASFFASPVASAPHRSFEGLGVEERLAFMLFLSWWFNQRPERWMMLGSEVERR
jgi:hypothetical protein